MELFIIKMEKKYIKVNSEIMNQKIVIFIIVLRIYLKNKINILYNIILFIKN